MLLWMKAMVDGMRSMIYTGAFWSDLALELEEEDRRHHFESLLDFITPIIKAYCSDMGFRVCETAIQCLGGYGYCRDYHLEQYLRDAKIMSLYEGTNGVQSLDLMGRKMRVKNGAAFRAFRLEIDRFVTSHQQHPELGDFVRRLGGVVDRLDAAAAEMRNRMQSDPLLWAAATYPALLCFGDAVMAWRLLDLAIIAHRQIQRKGASAFYRGKILQATYFADTVLPLTMARLQTCLREGREVVEMPTNAF
jgi:hypothetical protein